MTKMKIHKIILGLAAMSVWNLANAEMIGDGVDVISEEALKLELNSVPAHVREKMSKDQMARYISNHLIDERLKVQAIEQRVNEIPEVIYKLRRSEKEILVRGLLDKVLKEAEAEMPDLIPLARQRYEVDKAQHVVAEAVKVAHILVRTEPGSESQAEQKAQELLARIRAGEDFGELAKAHSEDKGSAGNGGLIDRWSEKGKFVPEFEKMAFSMKVGEVSEPVKTRFGLHILKLMGKREARQLAFDEVSEIIVGKLKNEYLGQKRNEFLKKYMGTQPIVLSDELLERLRQ
ncbi:MAG: peptidylprolyl isomerase [Pseudomonadota bacterium]